MQNINNIPSADQSIESILFFDSALQCNVFSVDRKVLVLLGGAWLLICTGQYSNKEYIMSNLVLRYYITTYYMYNTTYLPLAWGSYQGKQSSNYNSLKLNCHDVRKFRQNYMNFLDFYQNCLTMKYRPVWLICKISPLAPSWPLSFLSDR